MIPEWNNQAKSYPPSAHDKMLAALLAAKNFGSKGETENGISVSYLIDEAIKAAKAEGKS